MEFHPVADFFPLMTGKPFEDLKEDILRNGQHHPILIADGKIADGRNRYNACIAIGVKPKYIEWDGKGLLADRVFSENVSRRHLDSNQISAAWVKRELYIPLEVEAKERQREAVIESNKQRANNPSGKKFSRMDDRPDERSAAKAASILKGTNQQYIKDAKAINKRAPEVIDVIIEGKIKIPDAKEVAKLPEEERKEVIENIKQGEKPKDAIKKAKGKIDKNGTDWSEYEIERMNAVMAGGVVYANIRSDWQLWEWAMREGVSLNVSDTSPFQNPFQCPGDGEEHEVLDHYRQYLAWKPTLTSKLKDLSQRVIGCRCLTDNCHCAILKEYITIKEMP